MPPAWAHDMWVAVLLCRAAWASPPEDLDGLVAEALARDPEGRVLEASRAAATDRARAAGRTMDPQLMVGVDALGAPEDSPDPMMAMAGVNQMLRGWGEARAARDRGRLDADRVEADQARWAADLRFELWQSAATVRALTEERVVLDQQLTAARAVREIGRARWGASAPVSPGMGGGGGGMSGAGGMPPMGGMGGMGEMGSTGTSPPVVTPRSGAGGGMPGMPGMGGGGAATAPTPPRSAAPPTAPAPSGPAVTGSGLAAILRLDAEVGRLEAERDALDARLRGELDVLEVLVGEEAAGAVARSPDRYLADPEPAGSSPTGTSPTETSRTEISPTETSPTETSPTRPAGTAPNATEPAGTERAETTGTEPPGNERGRGTERGGTSPGTLTTGTEPPERGPGTERGGTSPGTPPTGTEPPGTEPPGTEPGETPRIAETTPETEPQRTARDGAPEATRAGPPELDLAAVDLRAAEADERVARVARRPDLMLSAGQRFMPMGDMWMPMGTDLAVGLELPLWGGRGAGLDAARAESAAAEARLDQVERDLTLAAVRARAAVATAEARLAGLEGSALPRARQAWSTTRELFGAGQVSADDTLLAWQALVQVERDAVAARRDVELRQAELARLEGR